MWKRKLVWKNDSIEFTFQDQILSLEESIQDDKMRFKASMKKGNQVKEVELRMTLKTVPEEINNLVKTEKQEYYEYEQQGSLKDPIKLEKDSNELTDSHRIECELEDTASSIRQDNEKKDNENHPVFVRNIIHFFLMKEWCTCHYVPIGQVMVLKYVN